MTAPTIPAYAGQDPNRDQNNSVFSINMNDALDYMLGLSAHYNGLSSYLDTLSTAMDADKVAAAASAAAAATSAATSAGSANYVGDWSTATGTAISPASYTHNGGLWLLKSNLGDITTSEPSTTNSDWFLLDGDFTSFVIANSGTLIWKAVNEIQGNVTVTSPAANSTNANGFLRIYVAEKYKGATVTINRSASDLFDDGTSTDTQLILNFPAGGEYILTSDGNATIRV